MGSYAARRGARTGAMMWRALSDGPEKRITPDGVMDLMWFQHRLVVAGPDTRTMIVETQADEVTWGLQLAPGAAYALLGVPAHELTDRRVELSELVALPRHDGWSFEDNAADALERIFVALLDASGPRPLRPSSGCLSRPCRSRGYERAGDCRAPRPVGAIAASAQ